MNRAVRGVAWGALALLMTTGCSSTDGGVPVDAMMANVSSIPKGPSVTPVDGLRPGQVDTLLLSDDDVSTVVGLPMHRTGLWRKPARVVTLRDRNECKVLTVSDLDFWTTDFTAFRQTAQKDSDEMNFFAWQGVGTYPNGSTASRVFQRTLNAGLESRCRTALVPAEDDEQTVWHVDALTITDTEFAVTLTKQRDGELAGWRCATQIRTRRNVIQRQGACQMGNPSTTTQQLADITTDRIGG